MKIEPVSMLEPCSALSEDSGGEFRTLIKDGMKVKKVAKVVREVSSIKKYKNKIMKRRMLENEISSSILHSSPSNSDVSSKKNVKMKGSGKFSMQEAIDRKKFVDITNELLINENKELKALAMSNVTEKNIDRLIIKKTNPIILLSSVIANDSLKNRILLFPFRKYKLLDDLRQLDYSQQANSIDYSVVVNVEPEMFKLNPCLPGGGGGNVNRHFPSTMNFIKMAGFSFPLSTSNSLSNVLYHNHGVRSYRVFFKGFHYMFKLNGDNISFKEE